MTLETLGSHAGVTYQQIQKYEIGANRIGASVLYRLAKALQVDFEVLFENVGDAAAAPAQPASEDVSAALALKRIENLAVRDTIRGLIGLLDQGSD